MPPRHDLASVPDEELELAADLLFADPKLYDVAETVSVYKALGLKVIRDPDTDRLSRYARIALTERRPFSAIRVSDGEFCVLAYRQFDHGTPTLDSYIARQSLGKQSDSFAIGEMWLIAIREMLVGSIAGADIVGVSGMWNEDGPTRGFRRDPQKMRKAFKSGPRGLYGDWKGRLYMPKLARDGYLDGKVVASNHFYMAFLNSLSRLVHSAASVLLMTGHEGLLPAFQLRFPDREIALLKIGNATDPRRGKLKVPYFLQDYHDAMPEDLTGVLCLVGGGPWSLIYCSWIRQRGGVAIDIGSGFDLLAGKTTRSTHRRIGEKAAEYALIVPDAGNSSAAAP